MRTREREWGEGEGEGEGWEERLKFLAGFALISSSVSPFAEPLSGVVCLSVTLGSACSRMSSFKAGVLLVTGLSLATVISML